MFSEEGRPVVLLADDNPQDVLLAQRAFKKASVDCSLAVVTDGDDAVAYLAGTGKYGDRKVHPLPVLMLLDIKMPRRSGLDVLQWSRAQPHLKQLTMVMLTSSNESEDVKKAYELGANSFLVKPVAFSDLLEMVKALQIYWLTLNQRPHLC